MLINIAERAYAEVERIFRVILPESGLTVREEQITLCHSMLDSLLHNTISLCDAGVGIGKTYAYLVACILARKYSIQLSRPLVISTSSVALQEAILGEYLPFLSKVLLSNSVIDEPLTAYLRKGKERFVCDERLSQRLKAVAGTKKNAKQLAALRSLMLRYDLDTVTGLSEFDRRQVCVPKACPKSCARKDTCRYHVYLRQAQSGPAMIQICNHNYLLADAEHRRQGFHSLLKGYGILVVDEAHKLWDAACQMYGEALSSQDFEELTNLLEKEKCSQAVHTLREKSAHFAAAFRQVETREDERCRLPLILTSIRSKVLMDCENSFSQIKRTLPEKVPRWLVHRLEKMERTTRLFREQDSRYIRYLKYDRDGTPFLCAVNKDIPKQLRRALWEQRIPVILTSGTLKAGNDFHPAMEKTGLDSLPNVRTYSAPSPFDYKRNCLLYFPESSKGEPHGSNSESKRIAKEILQLVHATGGHTLVLFTSYSLMGAVYSLVKDQMPVPLMEVWRNSQDTIRRFKREQNAVLFAAGSCWEGIDFPGDIVSSLIVPRLPFPVPDPIREAQRPNYMTLQDYIQAVIVPEMQVKLRQGFGRAIRTETDTCVVSILDHRAALGGKYHQEVMEALPPVPVTRQIEDVEQFIRARKGPDYFFVYGREQMCLKTEKCERFGFTAGAEGRV